jgi:hypothetical protein
LLSLCGFPGGNQVSLKKMIEKICRSLLDEYFKERQVINLPESYNSLEKIRGEMLRWVRVPFNGAEVWCQLRCLNSTQRMACGDYSSIVKEGKKKALSTPEIIAFSNYQEALCRASFVRPTFDEIATLVNEKDFVIRDKKKEFDELKKTNLNSLTTAQKLELERRMERTELFFGFILPSDTMTFITSWAHGSDVSDIKKITDEQFLSAAILASNGHDNPSDHIDGQFTDGDRPDIDRYAWHIHSEFLKQEEIALKAKRGKR